MTNENTATTKTAAEIAEFEAQTGWSWSDAVDEASEIRREIRIFGSRRNRTHRRGRRMSYAERFEAVTGWTLEAARELAWDLQRERRIFGRVA